MMEQRAGWNRARRAGGRRPRRLLGVLVACGAALVPGAPGTAAGLGDTPALRAGSEGFRPAAAIPLTPASFPEGIGLDFASWSAARERPTWPLAFREAGRATPGVGEVRPLRVSRLSDRLIARMETEARRHRGEGLFDVSTGRVPLDSVWEEQRAREAERIVTRALDRTLDDQVEHLARTSLGLGGVLAWLDDFGGLSLGTGANGGVRGHGGGTAPRGSPSADLGLRLGTHPRLVLRTEFLGIRGRLEVSVLEQALHLTFERPLGPRARAALSGGRSRDGDDWAALTLSIGL